MNKRYFTGFVLTTMLFGFLACKKEENATIADPGYSGPKMVGFNNYDGYQQASIPIKDSFISIEYEVKLSNTTSTANAPITVKLVKDNNPIFEYNDANGTTLSPVPVNAYRFDETQVTIPKGARTAKVRFQINPVKLSGGTPAFGLSIFSVSGDGATVINEASQTHLVVEIIALNQWDGTYKSSVGYFYHPTSPRNIPDGTIKHCYTSGANSVYTELGDFNGVVQGPTVYYVTLTIDANNNVTIGPGPGAAPAASPVVTLSSLTSTGYTPFTGSTPALYTNKWDPNAKKFYLRYGYMGTNGYRIVEEVLTKQ